MLYDVLHGWKHLFQDQPYFKQLVKVPITSSLKPLLKNLREDYVASLRAVSPQTSANVSRVVRLARCMLLYFLQSDFYLEAEAIVSLMVHTIQPERGGGSELLYLAKQFHTEEMNPPNSVYSTGKSRAEEVFGAVSRLAVPKGPAPNYTGPVLRSGIAGGGFLLLGYPGGGGGPGGSSNSGQPSIAALIPAHPAGVCLEALLSFLLSDGALEKFAGSGAGSEGGEALVVAMTSMSVTVSALLSEALALEANVR